MTVFPYQSKTIGGYVIITEINDGQNYKNKTEVLTNQNGP